jgi:hypothetical protein
MKHIDLEKFLCGHSTVKLIGNFKEKEKREKNA